MLGKIAFSWLSCVSFEIFIIQSGYELIVIQIEQTFFVLSCVYVMVIVGQEGGILGYS